MDTTGVLFDEDTLFDGLKMSPPPLFTEDFIELTNDNGVQFDQLTETDNSLPTPSTGQSKELTNDNGVQFDQLTETDNSLPTPSTGQSKGNKLRISDSARKTRQVILDGFEKATTASIFMKGEICFDIYENTRNANTMMEDIEKHRDLLEDESTADACQWNEFEELLKAIQEKNYVKITQLYYRSQHKHTFNAHDKPKVVPVYIGTINKDWVDHIKNAMQSINDVTPGINLVQTTDKQKSRIEIGEYISSKDDDYTKIACTDGSIKNGGNSFIHLGHNWNKGQMKGTSVHELMHALGFYHEMQRNDSNLYLEFADPEKLNNNYQNCFDAITRFDPFSVMMYSESHQMKRKNDDTIWLQKPSTERAQELSELNKVALNLKFKPCKRLQFIPNLDRNMGMVYCGRKVMLTHSQVGKNTTDGYCGKHNWANCAACRVFLWFEVGNEQVEIQKLKSCLKNGKWQGLSGLFYCGKDLSSGDTSRKCGPDNGDPCSDCEKELYHPKEKSYSDYLKCQIS